MTEIDLRYLAESQPSLCIPRVFNNITESRVRQVFDELGLGRISAVDIKERKNEKDESYKRIYIHFEKWFWNEDAQSARKKLISGKEIKIVYDNPWFWKVSASKWTPSRDYEIGGATKHKRAHIIDDRETDNYGRDTRLKNEYEERRKSYDNYDRRRDTRDLRRDLREYRNDSRDYRRDSRDRNDSRDYRRDSRDRNDSRDRKRDNHVEKTYSKPIVEVTPINCVPSLPQITSYKGRPGLKLKKKNDSSKPKVENVVPLETKEKKILVLEEKGELEEGEVEEEGELVEEIEVPKILMTEEQKELLDDLYGDI